MASEDGLTGATKDPHIALQCDLLLLASVQMSFSGHLLSVVCMSVRLRTFHIFYSRTIGPNLTRLTRRRGFFIDKIKGRYISKAEIITASMCNEDWHGYGSKLFLDYNFNTAICDHSSVQASSSSYPQIKVTVTYFWYLELFVVKY